MMEVGYQKLYKKELRFANLNKLIDLKQIFFCVNF